VGLELGALVHDYRTLQPLLIVVGPAGDAACLRRQTSGHSRPSVACSAPKCTFPVARSRSERKSLRNGPAARRALLAGTRRGPTSLWERVENVSALPLPLADTWHT
jgi:hypothetical protein